jgi:hypothetical protein
MKYVNLTNTGTSRLDFPGLTDGSGKPLVFEPGATKAVHPRVALHPVLRGLKVETGEPVKEAKKAPVPVAAPVVVAEPEPAPEPAPESEPEPTPAVVEDLRDLYLSAPGITDGNVDAVLEKYPTLDMLKAATKEDLVDCGISKNASKRIKDWADEQ